MKALLETRSEHIAAVQGFAQQMRQPHDINDGARIRNYVTYMRVALGMVEESQRLIDQAKTVAIVFLYAKDFINPAKIAAVTGIPLDQEWSHLSCDVTTEGRVLCGGRDLSFEMTAQAKGRVRAEVMRHV